ncbi:hypothetical protein EVAR_48040_1 [Eumeta japonica]|uniref:Uncharacterized protein n=1 Tax=Eumeta variegata TaxID=151549 RepID=A0A4C1XKF6_EUMVA|nr:hypothetical protein EVAR_48040_1 [Eumeta japonica]
MVVNSHYMVVNTGILASSSSSPPSLDLQPVAMTERDKSRYTEGSVNIGGCSIRTLSSSFRWCFRPASESYGWPLPYMAPPALLVLVGGAGRMHSDRSSARLLVEYAIKKNISPHR